MSLLVHDTHLAAQAGDLAGATGGTLSPAGLVAYVLGQKGLGVEVTLRGWPTARAGGAGQMPPVAGLYLREGVSVGALAEVLRGFLGSPHTACLMVSRGTAREYRERLHVDGEDRVVRVERHFERVGETAEGRGGDRIVGGIVLLGPAGQGHRTPRSVFALLRRGLAGGGSIQVARLLGPRGTAVDMEAEILEGMSAEERAELAQRLGFRQVGEDCFAAEGAKVAEGAFLRGPLFIDAGVEIAETDIHVGPAWLRTGGAGVTVAARGGGETDGAGAAAVQADGVTPLPATGPEYFVGPTTRRKPVYDFCKRVFDFTFALFWMIVLSPILLTTALLIKLYDWGPIFFVHEREGLYGKPFGCVKFRSMVRNAEALKEALKAKNLVDGPQFKVAKDPRITPLGRFIRMTNIDELPQLWNVLLGQMSIVGPRPSPFKENQLCPPWREARLSVKPGITGLWQVSRSRKRGAADFQEWIVYDTQYVERRGFFLDMKLILLTVKEILGKGQ